VVLEVGTAMSLRHHRPRRLSVMRPRTPVLVIAGLVAIGIQSEAVTPGVRAIGLPGHIAEPIGLVPATTVAGIIAATGAGNTECMLSQEKT
jgi:hypothetical protein